MNRRGLKAAFVLCLCLSYGAGPEAVSRAEGPGLGREADKSPVVVTARSLLADNKKKVVVYHDDVVVKKGDITLYADEVVVRLAGSGKTAAEPSELVKGSGRIDTIEAKGNVRIIQQDKTATADEAVYYSGSEKIVLSGGPRVWQGANVLTGKSITYDLNEDTFLVEDAKTVLYQDEGAAGPVPGAAGR